MKKIALFLALILCCAQLTACQSEPEDAYFEGIQYLINPDWETKTVREGESMWIYYYDTEDAEKSFFNIEEYDKFPDKSPEAEKYLKNLKVKDLKEDGDTDLEKIKTVEEGSWKNDIFQGYRKKIQLETKDGKTDRELELIAFNFDNKLYIVKYDPGVGEKEVFSVEELEEFLDSIIPNHKEHPEYYNDK